MLGSNKHEISKLRFLSRKQIQTEGSFEDGFGVNFVRIFGR